MCIFHFLTPFKVVIIIFKRIISCFLVVVILFVSMVVPVSAVDAPTSFWQWLGGQLEPELTLEDYWSVLIRDYGVFEDPCPSPNSSDGRHNFVIEPIPNPTPLPLPGLMPVYCQWCHYEPTHEDFQSAYDTYVSDLETDLGSTVLIDGGVRVYLPSGSVTFDSICDQTRSSYTVGVPTHIEWYSAQTTSYKNTATTFKLASNGFTFPFSCTYELGNIAVFSSWSSNTQWGVNVKTPAIHSDFADENFTSIQNRIVKSGSGVAGGVINVNENRTVWHKVSFTVGSITDHFIVDIYSYIDLFPVDGVSSVTDINIDQSTRVGSVAGDFIYGDQIIENMQIVNETNNTFFNPVTNETINYNNWSYDYSDRSYNLTLETGASVEVRFGDEYLTINEGDTIYNIYYYITNEAPPVDPDAPSGDDVNGFFAWWQEAWTSFVDRFFSGSGGSGGFGEDIPAVPDNEATEEDDGWSILDLLKALKDGTWKLITGTVSLAFDGITGFISSVLHIGDFFDGFSETSENSLLFVPVGDGGSVWD